MKLKSIYITDEQWDYLDKQDNAASLIRSLLNAHMEKEELALMTPEQKKIKLKEVEIQLEAIKKIEKLKNEQ